MRFIELDKLLNQNDDTYYFSDSFMLVNNLLSTFSPTDWEQLLTVWNKRPLMWKERLSSDLSRVNIYYLKRLLDKALVNQENEIILRLMNHLPSQSDGDLIYERLLDFAVQYWHQCPEARNNLKQCCWQIGISKRFLGRLGFNQWNEIE